jgi:hypothetical protein
MRVGSAGDTIVVKMEEISRYRMSNMWGGRRLIL